MTPHRPQLRRVTVTQQEAAAMFGVSVDFFAEHIAPALRVIREGRLRLYPVVDVEAWVERNAQPLI